MPTFSPGTIPSFAPGLVTAAQLNTNVKGALDDLRAKIGSPTPWTPVLTAATTNPTNYTGSGWYIQNGDLVVAQFKIVSGASWTVGSGAYTLSLPVNADVTLTNASSGTARLAWSGGSTYGTPRISSATTCQIFYMSSFTASAVIAHNLPAAWSASGELMNGQIIYRAA